MWGERALGEQGEEDRKRVRQRVRETEIKRKIKKRVKINYSIPPALPGRALCWVMTGSKWTRSQGLWILWGTWVSSPDRSDLE
jgi:hypothetical protein